MRFIDYRILPGGNRCAINVDRVQCFFEHADNKNVTTIMFSLSEFVNVKRSFETVRKDFARAARHCFTGLS